jgi:hypothetical protein
MTRSFIEGESGVTRQLSRNYRVTIQGDIFLFFLDSDDAFAVSRIGDCKEAAHGGHYAE